MERLAGRPLQFVIAWPIALGLTMVAWPAAMKLAGLTLAATAATAATAAKKAEA